jgi:YYY domain-containing protein
MIDEPMAVARPRRAWQTRELWVGAAVLVVAVVAIALRAGTGKLALSPSELRTQATHGTWRQMFDLNGVAAAVPLPLWALAVLAAGWLGFPYLWLAARSLPDRGYGAAKVVGLLLVTWLVWLLASVRLLAFTRLAIAVAIVAVAVGAAAIVVMHRDELVPWLRRSWRLLLVGEAVFWVIFLAALYVRWSNPDLWHPDRGGEKPMDFAYLNAVTKSTHFPPYDPWFAGGQMNYYYFGFVQVATLTKLTAIPPAVAYNLAVPTLAGLLAAAVFSSVLGLGARGKALRRRLPFAVFGALLVTVLGNLGEVRVLRSALHQTVPNDWWFWNASRVIHPGPGEPGPITEFPSFTFIYGDLHAHAMALPLAALAVMLTVAVVRAREGPFPSPLLLALLGLTLGALWVTNTWDFPTYALVAGCGLAIWVFARGRSVRHVLVTGGAVGVVLATAYLSFLPFHARYEAVFDGVDRWHGRQTRFFDYLTIHGLFLFAIVSALIVQLSTSRDLSTVARVYRLGLRSWDRHGRFRELRRAFLRPRGLQRLGLKSVPAAVLLGLVCAALGQWPTATALAVATLAILSWPARARANASSIDQRLRRLLIVFVLVGSALTVAVEFFVVRNIDIGRTNTVFKLYLQVWLLWGLAAAASAVVVYERLPALRRRTRESWRAVFVVLVAAAATYPVLAAHAKINDRFDTSAGRSLDGMDFMRTAVLTDKGASMPLDYDRSAIVWMLEHVNGSPVVAEANTAPTLYGWELRYAMFTGNPAIVGWDYHQRQQRPSQSSIVQSRVEAVQMAYRTDDARAAYDIFTRYGASYAVLGPLERVYFPEGVTKWARGIGRYWTVAYSNPGVTIYKLIPATRGSSTT